MLSLRGKSMKTVKNHKYYTLLQQTTTFLDKTADTITLTLFYFTLNK